MNVHLRMWAAEGEAFMNCGVHEDSFKFSCRSKGPEDTKSIGVWVPSADITLTSIYFAEALHTIIPLTTTLMFGVAMAMRIRSLKKRILVPKGSRRRSRHHCQIP